MEAQAILGTSIQSLEGMKEAARAICELGPASVVVKGGHLDRDRATDVFYDGHKAHELPGTFTQTRNTHGTGCTFSSAIAANLALGASLPEAVRKAKAYISEAIAHGLDIGKGHGPTHHFYGIKMVEG
jgi:hydroxymethylpyrimidine/phosphomethylpyrimidine kinase